MLLVIENKYIEVPNKFIEDSEFLSSVLDCDENMTEIVVLNVSYESIV